MCDLCTERGIGCSGCGGPLDSIGACEQDCGRQGVASPAMPIPASMPIPIRRRDPAEVRARILASALPPDLAAALADEIGPES